MRLVALVLLLVLSGVTLAQGGPGIKIDVEKLNESIGNAVLQGEIWPQETLQVTRELFGGNKQNYLALPQEELRCGGHKDKISVVIMRGSFSRAWTRGDWCEVHYRKIDDGTWRLCYVLPMSKEGAKVRNDRDPMKASRPVQRVE